MAPSNDALPWHTFVWRSLSRRRLRTVLTVAGIATCLSFFVLISSLSEGMKVYIDEELERNQVAEIYVGASPALTEGEVNLLIDAFLDRTTAQGLAGHAEEAWSLPIIVEYGKGGFAYYERYQAMVGVPDGGLHQTWYTYDHTEELVEGRHLDTVSGLSRSVVLGNELWNRYFPQVHAGDVIDITLVNTSWEVLDLSNWTGEIPSGGEPIGPLLMMSAVPNLTVVGILAPSGDHRLDGEALVPLDFMLAELHQVNDATGQRFIPGLELTVEEGREFDFNTAEEAMRRAVPRIDGWDNREWISQEWMEDMSDTVDGWFLIVTVIIALVTVLGVSNTMAMSVAERAPEIGVMRAIGFRSRQMMALIYAEALVLVTVALALGLSVGVGLSLYFDAQFEAEAGMDTTSIYIAPAQVGPATVMLAAAIAFMFGVIAASLPARRSATMDIVEVVRDG